MLKRVNIHIEVDTLKELDKIIEKLKSVKRYSFCYSTPTRADLIRLALKKTYQLEMGFCHTNEDKLAEEISNILKPLKKKRS